MIVGQPDTDDLRAGAPIHDDLLALLPLVGRWRGTGVGIAPSSEARFRFVQDLSIAHDGRPFLVHESRSWLLAEDGEVVRAAERETGFWRPGPGQDDVELVLATNTGQALVLTGVAGEQTWDLHSTSITRTPSAVPVDGERRLCAVRGTTLSYATELAVDGAAFRPHLNASLARTTPPVDGVAAEAPRPGRD